MQTSSINQLPIYQDSDALQYGTQQSAIIKALDPRITARFASLSAANSAYSAFVSGGGAMTDGMFRSVAGDPQIYAGGQWRGIRTLTASQITFYATTIWDATETGIAQLSVPDPGWPYILDTSAVVAVAAQAGVQVNVQVRLDSVSGTIISQISTRSGALPAGEIIMVPIGVTPSGTLTGSHTLVVSGVRTAGSGNWAVGSGGSIVNAMIRPSYV